MRDLRRTMTPAEQVLWQALRGRQLGGLRFRCQHPVGPFVLDFYCPAAKLVIEVDGAVHEQQREQDQARTNHLQQYGYRVLRFTNDQVLNNLDIVMDHIRQATQNLSATQRTRRKKPAIPEAAAPLTP
ncbi:MAG TPA: endonuclease domain-containing protein [Thermomicrobiales bacterium]